MTFGRPRNNPYYQWELIRFCNKNGYTVVGGADKLFKYFLRKYEPQSIISYADRTWSTTISKTVYDTLGFVFDSYTIPNYSYIINNKRKHRFAFRKSRLVKQGSDNKLSEQEILKQRNIFRVYDCGHIKYKYC